jgi:hypothetical protein
VNEIFTETGISYTDKLDEEPTTKAKWASDVHRLEVSWQELGRGDMAQKYIGRELRRFGECPGMEFDPWFYEDIRPEDSPAFESRSLGVECIRRQFLGVERRHFGVSIRLGRPQF